MVAGKLDTCQSVNFLTTGFLGWPAYPSTLLRFLWFVGGRILSSQPTEQ